MVSSLSVPPSLVKPFANEGDKNIIPTDATGTQAASLEEGFPEITATPINEGGIPPKREDFNGLGFLTTSQYFYLQNGGRFTFNPEVSSAINGYPEGAVLQYTDPNTGQSFEVTSLLPNNTYNFVSNPEYIDGVKWRRSFFEDLTNYVTTNTEQTITGIKSFATPIRVIPRFDEVEGEQVVVSYPTVQLHGGISKGTNPSSTQYWEINFQDEAEQISNIYRLGGIQSRVDSSGNSRMTLQAFQNTSGVSTNTSIYLQYGKNGTITTYAPPVTNSNGIVTQAALNKAAKGYLKLGNGMILQWGKTTTPNAVTFGTAYTETPTVVAGQNRSTADQRNVMVYDITTTGFKTLRYNNESTGLEWISFGY